MGVFKGVLSLALRICPEKYLAQEIKILIKFIGKYHQRIHEEHFFYKRKKYADIIKKETTISTETWSKVKSKIQKFGIKTMFTLRRNLKIFLTWDKSKLLPNKVPDVYQLDCTSSVLKKGETKKKVGTRTIEHQQDKPNKALESPDASEPCQECYRSFIWISP